MVGHQQVEETCSSDLSRILPLGVSELAGKSCVITKNSPMTPGFGSRQAEKPGAAQSKSPQGSSLDCGSGFAAPAWPGAVVFRTRCYQRGEQGLWEGAGSPHPAAPPDIPISPLVLHGLPSREHFP